VSLVTPEGLAPLVVILLTFCLWHASGALGVRRSAAFVAIAVVTSWVFEEIGVLTGLVYGSYEYTSTLGQRIGSVPALIPLAWFVLAYPTYIVVNLVADGWPVGTPGGPRRLVGLALAGAILMTAWDLVLDPILSGPDYHAWTWGAGGGVPVHNYLGWAATSFVIFVLYRTMERREPRRRSHPEPSGRGRAGRDAHGATRWIA
jgi:uncharacterized membrane protein